MKTKCTHCDQEFDTTSEQVGMTASCTQCGMSFVILDSTNDKQPPILQPAPKRKVYTVPARSNSGFVNTNTHSEEDSGGFWTFRKMITPSVIQIWFWLDVATCLIWGAMLLVENAGNGFGPKMFFGLGLIFLGPLLSRLWCEFCVVVFSINNTLTDIRNFLRNNRAR